MALKYTKWTLNIPTYSIVRTFKKIYPNWDFWFESMPSDNPVYVYVCAEINFPGKRKKL
jgi:hypothetical protein